MTVLTGKTLSDVGIDAVAIKPTEVDLSRTTALDVGTITFDYEGREHLPESAFLSQMSEEFDVRVTVPVRADGFDPRGDQQLRQSLPESVSEVLVAGHQAYLDEREQKRAVAPRLTRAAESAADPWIGTEGIERLALAVGGTQFELLSPGTESSVRALREAGFGGEIAVYAPVVLTDDEAEILDAVGEYAARRPRVASRLPEDTPADSTVTGPTRDQLYRGCREFALVGSPESVADQVDHLTSCGVDHIVGYPARGLDPILADE